MTVLYYLRPFIHSDNLAYILIL